MKIQEMIDELTRAKRHLINFTDGRHNSVIADIEKAISFIQDQDKLMDRYRKALIGMVLQFNMPDWGEHKLYTYAESAGERAFTVLGLEEGADAEPLERELWPNAFKEDS